MGNIVSMYLGRGVIVGEKRGKISEAALNIAYSMLNLRNTLQTTPIAKITNIKSSTSLKLPAINSGFNSCLNTCKTAEPGKAKPPCQ